MSEFHHSLLALLEAMKDWLYAAIIQEWLLFLKFKHEEKLLIKRVTKHLIK